VSTTDGFVFAHPLSHLHVGSYSLGCGVMGSSWEGCVGPCVDDPRLVEVDGIVSSTHDSCNVRGGDGAEMFLTSQ
jgi:hypothetical protein